MEKLKKIFAFFLAAATILSLCACAMKEKADSIPNTPEDAETADITAMVPKPAETVQPEDAPADDIGFFDPDFDYASAPRYKVQFVGLYDNILTAKLNEAFSHWASKMNIEYEEPWGAGDDVELFFQKLESFASQGIDGFLLDPLSNMYPRVDELLSELGVPWMSCLAAPRDYAQESAPLIHPWVKFDGYAMGADAAKKLFELKDALWPDSSYDQIGLITAAAPAEDYKQGAYDAWLEKTGREDHYFTAHSSLLITGGAVDADATPINIRYIIMNNPQIKYWLMPAPYLGFAESAAAVLDELGLDDNGCVVISNVGLADELQSRWATGEQGVWRAAQYVPYILYAEPIIGALYAFMSGQATPETIWPQWVNVNDCGGAGGTYASLIIPSNWIDQDNYKHVLKWTDVYAGSNFFSDYPAVGITPDSYNARTEVPAYYSIKAQD